MKDILATKERRQLLIVSTVFLVVSIVGWLLFGGTLQGVVVALVLLLILAVQLGARREITQKQQQIAEQQHQIIRVQHQLHNGYFEQVEALFALHSLLNHSTIPLPKTRGWAASPDLLRLIVSLIYEKKPRLIVEAGSGVSTLVSGYCLQQIGSGRVVSFDHEKVYADQTSRCLRMHHLNGRCQVILAPLEAYQMEGGMWKWYSLDAYDEDAPIDLLIVDGPPARIQEMSRYPALPMLIDKMSENAIIILDDGNREDERHIVERWVNDFEGFSVEYMPLEKGAFILRRSLTRGSGVLSAPSSNYGSSRNHGTLETRPRTSLH